MNFARLRRYGLLFLLASLVASAWFLFSTGEIDVKKALAAIQADVAIAPIVFILALVLSTIFVLPLGLGLNLGAGIIWGGMVGGALTTVASLCAAVVSFLLARKLGDRYLRDYLQHSNVQTFLSIVQRHDWKLIFLVRLNPIVPFGLQNYLFGLTGISLLRYTVLSLLSCAIPSFLYANIGESLNNLVLTGNLRNLLTIAGLGLFLVTAGYVGTIYIRKTGAPSG